MPPSAVGGVVARGVQAVRQQHDQRARRPPPPPAASAASRRPGGEVGGAVPAQRDQLRQQVLRRPPHPLRLQHPHARRRTSDRRLQLRPPRARWRRSRPPPPPRPAPPPGPASSPRCRRRGTTARRCAVQVRVTMSSAPGRRDVLGVQRVEGAVQVEVAVQPRGTGRAAGCPRAFAGPTRPSCRNTRPGEPSGGRPQPDVGGHGQVGQHRGRGLRVAGDGRVERLRVELADLGRDLVERRVLRGRAAGGRGCGAARSRPGRERGWKPAGGYPAGSQLFPRRPGARRVGVGGPQPVQQLVDHRLRACGPPRRRSGSGRTARRRRRRARSRGRGPARRAARPAR